LGLSGRIPARLDEATKVAVIDLVEHAETAGWSTAETCRYLELSRRRLQRWRHRQSAGRSLADRVPDGNPIHGITPAEEDEIVAVFHEWSTTDRSHRKLAHRGSWLDRFWVDPSTVRRVLARRDLVFHPPKRTTRSKKRPLPEWVEMAPNRIWIWIYDTTHWTALDAATTAIHDVVSKKWLGDITFHDETSTQVQAVFTRALRDEGLLERIEELAASGEKMSLDPDDDRLPVLLVMSDNGAQMTSGSTREFMALAWLATHYGRPGTPTDQAQIESFFGHLKGENPHLDTIDDIVIMRAELDAIRHRWNTVRLHQGIGYVTPDQEHRGEGEQVRQQRRDGLARARNRRIAYHRNNHPNPGPSHAD
jgi:putative transposase